ncbi:MAG TPA: hypothetical protein VMM58_03260 [Bacteroidota bacterium]|nr:hypothetical protein [Bacteroidota bacterium]
MKFSIYTPSNFNFWSTVYSHGWCALPPFFVDPNNRSLRVVLPDGHNKYTALDLVEGKKKIIVHAEGSAIMSSSKVAGLSSQIRSMMRLDESFDVFYAEAKRHPHHRWVVNRGAGRLLRCPTVFEDVVKMICTTNCSWALTEIMAEALVSKLGTTVSGNIRSFPSPEKIARCSESFLRKEIRCGYRAPYLLELSRRIAEGKLDIEQWRQTKIPTEELFDEVRAIKGVGPYAAGNILKLLGRYDYLGLDSSSRGEFYRAFKKGRRVKDSTIEKHYAQFGEWRGLFLWMDVTKEWYKKKVPF